MNKITVKKQSAQKMKKNYPLIVAEDLKNQPAEDGFVQFLDEKNNFLGIGYLSKQNKGAGWFLSQSDIAINQSFYESLFEEAKSYRSQFFNDQFTTAFRLFNGEGDGLGGLIIDYYDGYVVFSWYNSFVYSQKDVLIRAFQSIFPEIDGAYEKCRFDNASIESQHLYGNQAPEPLLVLENGVTYATYLNEGLMTGIFLDQKNVRAQLVNGLSAGKTLLNMFSYTGAFSLAGAFGGASQTTSVDLAKRSLDKTKEQFIVNGIDPETQKIYVMDVFGYFNYAKKKELTYDVIILDPPSFARNKKKTFSVAKNYGELIEESIDILEKEGMIIASTNAANVSAQRFQQMIEEALQDKRVSYEIFRRESLPKDFRVNKNFPEGNYLKVLFIQVHK
ncbi:MAG: class I SAM-dependent rRNA methyltransferase [Streptococcaceae bacterium]|nr:class I SAM-dependent rRNA methyltransferase [Streptococcaceae bacterium]